MQVTTHTVSPISSPARISVDSAINKDESRNQIRAEVVRNTLSEADNTSDEVSYDRTEVRLPVSSVMQVENTPPNNVSTWQQNQR